MSNLGKNKEYAKTKIVVKNKKTSPLGEAFINRMIIVYFMIIFSFSSIELPETFNM